MGVSKKIEENTYKGESKAKTKIAARYEKFPAIVERVWIMWNEWHDVRIEQLRGAL
jgi:hypothetical protein